MRVFLTGASGHIGSAVIPELLQAGHQVAGLARSDQAAATIEAAGASVQRGTLDDLDILRQAAGEADGAIHLAFKHDWMASGDFAGAIEADFNAIAAIGEALAGSGKPFVTTSGTLMLTFGGIAGRPGTEQDALPGGPRVDAENYVIGTRRSRGPLIRRAPPADGAQRPGPARLRPDAHRLRPRQRRRRIRRRRLESLAGRPHS